MRTTRLGVKNIIAVRGTQDGFWIHYKKEDRELIEFFPFTMELYKKLAREGFVP